MTTYETYLATKPALAEFFVPTKPLTVIQGINRMGAATGSFRNVGAHEGADYNGHHLRLEWNSCRGYYVGYYFYAGHYVFSRTADFEQALAETLAVFDRQGAGASLRIECRAEDAPIAAAHPRLRAWTAEAEADADREWKTWQFGEINGAIAAEKTFGIPHTSHLIAATSLEDYRARIDAEFAARRSRIA